MRFWSSLTSVLAAIALAATAVGAGARQTRQQPRPAADSELGPPDKTLGSPSAPIVMEVFSDYSCPVCRSFYMGAIRPLLEDYVASGKLRIIHRDFPLTGVVGHEHSRQAALYETAAARIGKFEEVDAALYDKQAIWSRDGSVDAVVAAVLPPRDMARVREMVQSGKVDSYVDSDKALGTAKRVSSTPTVYVTAHGRTELVPGNVSYSLLRRFLDEQLQR